MGAGESKKEITPGKQFILRTTERGKAGNLKSQSKDNDREESNGERAEEEQARGCQTGQSWKACKHPMTVRDQRRL